MRGRESSEPNGFLNGEVHQDEPMYACLLAVVQQLLLTIADDWIIVPHEQNGYL